MSNLNVQTLKIGQTLADHHDWLELVARHRTRGFHSVPAWLQVFSDGLQHVPYVIEARDGEELVAVLPLAFVKSTMFGKFLVSLPYVNWAGVVSTSPDASVAVVDAAVQLADQLDVRFLELRHEQPVDHPALSQTNTTKVNMRLPLSKSDDENWDGLRSAVRSQIRKAERCGVEVRFGRLELLDAFYHIFCHNMRDLGTPVYGKSFFRKMLTHLEKNTELAVAYLNGVPIASALAVFDDTLTEVPSASSLRKFRDTAANSLMYWNMIQRAAGRGHTLFDFGRSTVDSGTYQFKRKWGAIPEASAWQYYVRRGDARDVRPDNARFQTAIRVWQRMPIWLTKLVGPPIVRGIP